MKFLQTAETDSGGNRRSKQIYKTWDCGKTSENFPSNKRHMEVPKPAGVAQGLSAVL